MNKTTTMYLQKFSDIGTHLDVDLFETVCM